MSNVSIIVPLYNKAPYVTKALESVKAQTFTDWECIIVNDGSTDNSLEVVDTWLKNNIDVNWCSIGDHWRLITQENAGVSAARNHGISLSTGDFVAFLDADDWWSPTFLEEMLQLVDQYPDAGIYGCDYYRVKNGKLLTYPKHANGYINYYKVYVRSGAMPLHPDGVLVPRRILDELVNRSTFNVQRSEWFPTGIKMGEDFLFFMKIVTRYKVAYLDKQLVYFNQDADANNRATTKLHDPKYHMLWNLGRIEDEGLRTEDVKDYKAMIDFLRVFSLGAYLQSAEYHDAAAAEMKKVSRWHKIRFTLKRYWMKIDNKMKKCICFLLILCVPLIMVNCSQNTTMVVLGDSLAAGHTLPKECIWGKLVAAALNLNLHNIAVNGSMLTYMDGYVGKEYSLLEQMNHIPGNPALIIVWAGTNDIYNNVNLDGDDQSTFNGALTEMCRRFNTYYSSSRVIVVTPMFHTYNGVPSAQVRNYIQRMVDICKLNKIEVVNLMTTPIFDWDNSDDIEKYTMQDGLHLNENGMQLVASKLVSVIKL